MALGSEALPLGSAKTPFSLSHRPGPRSCCRALARATPRMWPHAKALLTSNSKDVRQYVRQHYGIDVRARYVNHVRSKVRAEKLQRSSKAAAPVKRPTSPPSTATKQVGDAFDCVQKLRDLVYEVGGDAEFAKVLDIYQRLVQMKCGGRKAGA